MSKSIQDIVAAREEHQKALVPVEYTDYDEYINAQSHLTQRLITQPSKSCELCGYPMDYKGHKLTEREQKWSVHDVCRAKMEKQIDRASGINRDRRAKRVNTVT